MDVTPEVALVFPRAVKYLTIAWGVINLRVTLQFYLLRLLGCWKLVTGGGLRSGQQVRSAAR